MLFRSRRAGLENASIVDDEQLDYLREHDDLTLVAYSPILKGIYDDPAKRAAHAVMQSYAGPDAERDWRCLPTSRPRSAQRRISSSSPG